jgi:hypothetical protein
MIIILIYLQRTSASHHIAVPHTTSWHAGSPPHRGMAHRDVARQLTENDYHLSVWHDATMWHGLKRRIECSTSLVDYLLMWWCAISLCGMGAGKAECLLRLKMQNTISVRYVLSNEQKRIYLESFANSCCKLIRFCSSKSDGAEPLT